MIRVIGPTEKEVLNVAEKIEKRNKMQEHASDLFLGNIDEAVDEYKSDTSETNRASIIICVEFENKKLLFSGDSTSENILRAINKYYACDEFEIVKLPHHGSPRNISRELIKQIKSERFIISTNKRVDKVTLRRFLEEKENTEFLLNYDWWSNGYFTNDDRKKYIDTNKIVMRYIGEEKIRV